MDETGRTATSREPPLQSLIVPAARVVVGRGEGGIIGPDRFADPVSRLERVASVPCQQQVEEIATPSSPKFQYGSS
jgi:hypothetical protein